MESNLDLSKIPPSPGCYLYKNKNKKIIYIGKAKNLKKRISSYFSKKNLDPKTKALVKNIADIDFIVTNSENEAFLLENSLIKKYKPKYNIDLKDSKSYAFIEKTNEQFPRLIISRINSVKNKKSKKNLYGPFVSAESRTILLNNLNKTFKLRTCKRLPKRKCLRYDLGICSGPCIGKISKKEYEEDMKKAELILKGKDSELAKKLGLLMKKESKNRNYEKAIQYRNQKKAIEVLREKQNVQRTKNFNEDIINFIIKGDKVYLMVFNVEKGTLFNKIDFEFENKRGFLEEFILRYYSENKIPSKVILPNKIDNSLIEFLSYKKGSKVEAKIPKKGDLKALLDLVKKNIEIHFFGDTEKIEELKKVLNLQQKPLVMECFDISHLGGTGVVASMVQFRNGRPDKSNYRKFKIKSFNGNDDFRAMAEVVKRRYSRLKHENQEFPDLIIIDGGLGQLNSAISSLDSLNIKIPIISLAKKFEEIYLPGREIPIRLDKKNKARILLQAIRDEAHRFAITFQRQQRSKNFFITN